MECDDLKTIAGIASSFIILLFGLIYMVLYPSVPMPQLLTSLVGAAVGFLLGAGSMGIGAFRASIAKIKG